MLTLRSLGIDSALDHLCCLLPIEGMVFGCSHLLSWREDVAMVWSLWGSVSSTESCNQSLHVHACEDSWNISHSTQKTEESNSSWRFKWIFAIEEWSGIKTKSLWKTNRNHFEITILLQKICPWHHFLETIVGGKLCVQGDYRWDVA